MKQLIPSALLLAVLATAGSGLAFVEAVGDVAAFAESSTREAIDFGAQLTADAQQKAEALAAPAAFVVDNPGQAPILVQVAVSNAIFLKESGEAMAIGAANAIVADPISPWTFVRSWSDSAYAAAWMKADMAQEITGNFYETAHAVVALEAGALSQVPEAAMACGASARPLACAEDFVHTIVEA